jgi:hypothetical protein
MRSAEAAAVIQDAIDYIALMRESSGEDNGERQLVKDLERVIEFIQGAGR